MKLFKVIFFDPENPDVLLEDIVKAKTEIIAQWLVRTEGYEVKEIYEIHIEKNLIEKIKDYIEERFSTGVSYNVDTEISILKSFATSLKDWFEEKEALMVAKYNFWRSNKKNRKIIDKIVEDMDRPNISHMYEVFKLNDNVFSESFLTLMQQTKDTEIKIDKIISNPVSENEKWKKVEWYVELTESVNSLKKEIIEALTWPILWFIGTFSASLWIAGWLVPFMLKWMSNMRDISNDDYTPVWDSVIAIANFITNYGLLISFILASVIWITIFIYKTNQKLKEQIHLFLLSLPIISDILIVFQTKKITSLIAIFSESWMQFDKIFKLIIPLVPLIPIQKELEYIRLSLSSKDFDTIFSSYPDDEKYLTEIFYMQLRKESNRNSAITWRFGKAFAAIIKNTDDIWNIDLRKYPKRIGSLVKIIWLLIVVYMLAWIMLIIWMTITSSI